MRCGRRRAAHVQYPAPCARAGLVHYIGRSRSSTSGDANHCFGLTLFNAKNPHWLTRRGWGVPTMTACAIEVLIVADTVRTIIVEPTFTSVGVLGIIVGIRILLSWSLDVEIEGTWP